MNFKIKICGLKTEEVIEAAIEAGADMIGLNFHPKSPRYVAPETAAGLAAIARGRTEIAALVVDAGPGLLNVLSAHVSPDLWQLHGLETPTRCGEIKEWRRRPVMKALGVATPADLAAVANYVPIADLILLDAKPPKDATYPGGHGRPFDWNILSALPPDQPFMLSGGLTPENVGEAIRTVHGMGLTLLGVDVSTGVESAPGVKDPGKIRAFVAAAREAGGS